MSFDKSKFASVGAHSANTPTVWAYDSPDPLVTVKGSDYFNNKKFQIRLGDIIIANYNGAVSILYVNGLDPITTLPASGGGGQVFEFVDTQFLAIGSDWYVTCVHNYTNIIMEVQLDVLGTGDFQVGLPKSVDDSSLGERSVIFGLKPKACKIKILEV